MQLAFSKGRNSFLGETIKCNQTNETNLLVARKDSKVSS